MARVHPHVAIAMTAPMFEATAGIELQLGQGAFGAGRAGLALPFWDGPISLPFYGTTLLTMLLPIAVHWNREDFDEGLLCAKMLR